MSFVEQADSWRSKAHVSGSRLPALLGIVILVIGIGIFAGYHLITATSHEVFVIEQALTTEEQEASPASGDTPAEATTVQQTDTTAPPATTPESAESSSGNAAQVEALPQDNASTCFVHVGGCVSAPGVVELPASSRVSDAIAAAGGFSESAAPDALNLARLVTDGERIIVPSYEEYEASKASFDAPSNNTNQSEQTSENTPPSNTSNSGGLININTASSVELQTLNGVGPSTAEKIIADREASGPFNSIEDLMRVSGIGEKKFAALAPYICVG